MTATIYFQGFIFSIICQVDVLIYRPCISLPEDKNLSPENEGEFVL